MKAVAVSSTFDSQLTATAGKKTTLNSGQRQYRTVANANVLCSADADLTTAVYAITTNFNPVATAVMTYVGPAPHN